MDLELRLKKEFAKLESKLFVLAVSGGRDSIVLLDLASRLIKDRFIVAHFNHGLRLESREEEEFVRNLSKKYEVDFFTDQAEEFNKQENLEAWARNHRYEFLNKIRKEVNADYIVTAHHKDDLAETVLMRLIQGRASFSTGGIRDLSETLFRPMLCVSREEINQYVEQNQLKYIEDSSNKDTARLRNKLRLELIPKLISDYNPSIIDSLTLFSSRLKEDEEAIWKQAFDLFEAKNTNKTEFFSSLPSYLRWRLLKLEMERQVGESKVGYKALLRLSEALNTSEGSKKVIELGWGISCEFSLKGEVEFSTS